MAKYSVKDLYDVFNISNNCNIRDVLQKIKNDKVVKCFINKEKSDTGYFLRAIINSLSEYVNIEVVIKNGTMDLNNSKKMLGNIFSVESKWCQLAIYYITNNKLPNNKNISLTSSLRDKKLKDVLVNFFNVITKIQSTNEWIIKREFYIKSLAYELEQVCKDIKIPEYIHPKEGIDVYKSGDEYSEQKISVELKNICTPIEHLYDAINSLNLTKIKSQDSEIMIKALSSTSQIDREYAFQQRDVLNLVKLIIEGILHYLNLIYIIWTDAALMYRKVFNRWWIYGNHIIENKKDSRKEKISYARKFFSEYEDFLSEDINVNTLSRYINEQIQKLISDGKEKEELSIVLEKSNIYKIIIDKINEIVKIRFVSYIDQLSEYVVADEISKHRKIRKNFKKTAKQKKAKLPKPLKFKLTSK